MLPHKTDDLFPAPPRVRFAESFGGYVPRANPLRDLYPLPDELFHPGMYLGDHRPFDVMNGRTRVPAECGDVFGIRVGDLHCLA